MSIPINKSPLDRTISIKTAILLIALSFLFIAGAGILLGYQFFWDKYENISKQDYDYQIGLAGVRDNPYDSQAHIDLGWVYVQQKQYKKAISEYEKALLLDKKNLSAKYNLALVKVQVKDTTTARKLLEEIKEQDKDYLNGRATLGYVYSELGDYKKALAEFDYVKTRIPGNADLLYQYGRLYEKMNDYTKAKESYQAALKYNPQMTQARLAIERLPK